MAVQPSETKVALLAGGISGEREISLASGKGAAAALEQAGYDVVILDPARKADLKRLIDEPFDVAFLCLHGKYGEDGTMQGFLDLLGLPYTGPGVWSSATAMDKGKAKLFYERNGIPTPAARILTADDCATPAQLIAEFGQKMVIKPATEGSALGVVMAEGPDQVAQALEQGFGLDAQVLVEQFVDGTELTVAVLGNSNPYALPVIEIIPQGDFYDFESKYAPGGSQHICPARLTDEQTALAQKLAVGAHAALECSGMSRTDIIMDAAGDMWVLETNTIPGMTETSLLPDAARAAGIDFPTMCTRLIEYALERPTQAGLKLQE